MTENHIDVKNRGLILNAEWTKNRKPGFQPLPVSLLDNLQKFVKAKIASLLYEKFYSNFKDIELPENPLLYVPSHPAREMDKDLKIAGIPKTTPTGKLDFQACRVAFITYILEAGATVKEAQVLARHSTPDLNLNTYARANDSRLNALTEMVAERLLAQPTSKALLIEKEVDHNPESNTCQYKPNQPLVEKKQKKCALCVPKNLPHDLKYIINKWSALPNNVKESIKLLVRSSTQEKV